MTSAIEKHAPSERLLTKTCQNTQNSFVARSLCDYHKQFQVLLLTLGQMPHPGQIVRTRQEKELIESAAQSSCGCKTGERSHSLMCEPVSAWRAFRKACSRAMPGGSSLASSRRRLASAARRSSSWSIRVKRRRCCCIGCSIPRGRRAGAQGAFSPPMTAKDGAVISG
jgi:hypothetical protein